MNTDNNNDIAVEVDTTAASDIEIQEITWLYEPYIPTGAVVLLIGDGGDGKSFYSLALAAAISKGAPLPGADKLYPASNVIVHNSENPWASVILPRLKMLGADCGRIYRINEGDKRLTLTDARIEAAIRKHNAKFCILDPWQSLLDKNFSMNRSESVRPALTHLARVAERTQSSILLVGHISKSRGKAQHRGLGSVDTVNSVPSALFLGKAEGLDRDVRAVAHGKSNYAMIGKTILFRLSKADGFVWAGESDITPDEIMNYNAVKAREDNSKLGEASEFLLELLSEGEIPATEAIELADEAGISKITLERARKVEGVKSKRVDGHWVWHL